MDHTGAELELLETVAGRKQLVHEEVLAVGKPVLVVGILSSSSGSDDALGFSKGYGQGVCHGRRGRPAWPLTTGLAASCCPSSRPAPCFWLAPSHRLTNRWLLVSHRPEAEIRRDLWVRVIAFGSLSGALFAASIALFARGAMAPSPVPATAADGVAALRAAADGLALPAR